MRSCHRCSAACTEMIRRQVSKTTYILEGLEVHCTDIRSSRSCCSDWSSCRRRVRCIDMLYLHGSGTKHSIHSSVGDRSSSSKGNSLSDSRSHGAQKTSASRGFSDRSWSRRSSRGGSRSRSGGSRRRSGWSCLSSNWLRSGYRSRSGRSLLCRLSLP